MSKIPRTVNLQCNKCHATRNHNFYYTTRSFDVTARYSYSYTHLINHIIVCFYISRYDTVSRSKIVSWISILSLITHLLIFINPLLSRKLLLKRCGLKLQFPAINKRVEIEIENDAFFYLLDSDFNYRKISANQKTLRIRSKFQMGRDGNGSCPVCVDVYSEGSELPDVIFDGLLFRRCYKPLAYARWVWLTHLTMKHLKTNDYSFFFVLSMKEVNFFLQLFYSQAL